MKNLDWLVAEKVMNLKDGGDLPPYSTDLTAAWQVDKPEWTWRFGEYSDGLSVIIWHTNHVGAIADILVKWCEVPDIPTAYCRGRCRAALEAVGWEVENDL